MKEECSHNCSHNWQTEDDNRNYATQKCTKCGKWRQIGWQELDRKR